MRGGAAHGGPGRPEVDAQQAVAVDAVADEGIGRAGEHHREGLVGLVDVVVEDGDGDLFDVATPANRGQFVNGPEDGDAVDERAALERVVIDEPDNGVSLGELAAAADQRRRRAGHSRGIG